MAQSQETQTFLDNILALPSSPGVSLDGVLAKAIEDETVLRRLYANDRTSTRISNPYVGLVSVYDAPDAIRKTRARVVKDKEDLDAKHILPLADDLRRKEGTPSVAESLEQFQRNWNVFTEGALSQLTDWNNVVAAGGSVLACLLPLSAENGETKRAIRKFYHSKAYPTSDVDLFLWGLTPQQAEAKINQIYEAVRDSVPWDVTCIRTKSAITIYSQYPYRCVQIVLRLYHSPAEILAGFDVDAPCVAYDGSRVYANPRSIIALMRQANTVDMSRRSPSYEIRLSKYASRGFEIYVPDLRRNDIDPTIYERAVNRIEGLARLLVLERLSTPDARSNYLEARREMRSRPPAPYSRRMARRRRYKGDLKASEEIAGLEMSDYDTALLHVPYGPGWTAKRIDKLIYLTDLGTNSTFNPKNKDRKLHRHVAFFGTMQECLEDCCGYCPEPSTEEEKEQQKSEDKTYIRGRISFIEEDPGRQTMTGSFNPIDIGEWSGLAYLGPTEKLFNAIAAKDREAVQALLKDETLDINRRDPVGRTPLHVATLTKAEDICYDLIDAGARITPRLVSGRTVLHIAAQMNMVGVIKKLLERSAKNEEAAKEAEKEKEAAAKAEDEEGADSDEEHPSSVDDWSSDDDEVERKNKSAAKRVIALGEQNDVNEGDIPDDEANLPDILDINAADWDFRFNALAYAIIFGSSDAVDTLIEAGIDPKQAIPPKPNEYGACAIHPLALTTIIANQEAAGVIVDRLLRAGASSSQADTTLYSVFHTFVSKGKLELVEKLLVNDPTSKAAINVPTFSGGRAVHPLVTATHKSQYAMAALLLAHGANLTFSPEEIDKARKMSGTNADNYYYNRNKGGNPLDYLANVSLPVETSLATPNYLYHLFVNLGAQINVPPTQSFGSAHYDQQSRRSLVEMVQVNSENAKKKVDTYAKKASGAEFIAPDDPKTWAERRLWEVSQLIKLRESNEKKEDNTNTGNDEAVLNKQRLEFFREATVLLKEKNAVGWNALYPEMTRTADKDSDSDDSEAEKLKEKPKQRTQYKLMTRNSWNRETCFLHLLDSYDELFEACWTGDNAKIQELCLPPAKKNAKSNTTPLQISVKSSGVTADGSTHPRALGADGEHTPLSVAILARRWDTAKLIMEIVEAQWKKPDSGITAVKKFREAIDLNDDGSGSDTDRGCDSCESDDDYDDNQEVPTILDLASRPTAVQCEVSPEIFFREHVSSRLGKNGTKEIGSSHVLIQACAEGDEDAFLKLLEIANCTSTPIKLESLITITPILSSDSVNILDEFIRHTGVGIPSEALASHSKQEEGDEADLERKAQEAELSKRLYLGLSIHGVKRKDLAKRGDSYAHDQSNNRVPLLWSAIREGALDIVDYLHTSRPLDAYRAYSRDNSTDLAEAIRLLSDSDLEKKLTGILGIVPNSRRESAMTAAIVGRTKPLPMIKKLLALNPNQAREYLHREIQYAHFTSLLLATYVCRDFETIDFLLSNGVAVEDTDARGNNIMHIVCAKGYEKLLDHYLEKLPKEVLERLLQQKTFARYDGLTPLMFAVRNGKYTIVERLLQTDVPGAKATIPVRSARGLNVLHIAIQNGFADILELLLVHCDEDLLYVENTVGEAPVEIAQMRYILDAVRSYPTNRTGSISSLGYNDYRGIAFKLPRKFAKELDEQLISFRNLKLKTAFLDQVAGNTKLATALDEFETYLTKKLEEAKSLADANPEPEIDDASTTYVPYYSTTYRYVNSKVSVCDRAKTLSIVEKAAKTPTRRTLVRVSDVQQSVINSLDKAALPSEDDYYHRRHRSLTKIKELPDEVAKEKEDSMEQWNGVLGWAGQLQSFLG